MARFYSNENFPFQVVKELRLLGHDVVTVLESGKAGQAMPDEDVLEFAATEMRAVLTLNRKHFVRLHQNISTHSGIVVCTFDADFARQAARIDAVVRSLDSLNGILLRLNRPNEGPPVG